MQSLRCPAAAATAAAAAGPDRRVPAGGHGMRLAQPLRLAAVRPTGLRTTGAKPLHKGAQALPADAAVSTVEVPKQGCGRKRLFDDLGGAEGLKLAVDIFYEKVLADAELQPFFQAVDMQKQKAKQVKFMTFVFGGPDQYQGRSMYESHSALVKYQGLDHRHFDLIKQYLGETLQEMGVSQEVIQHAAGIVESTRPEFEFPSNSPNPNAN
ncbi:globin [Chlorella sorokiniana]|uniref:Globin n=1 Tax=Chlorella sorokiniana TaxID=3076 RepID=A0A2P6TJJ4_CHLSO|nr:globin [Chlorella sorokiniana]|eukprot:PRW44235.1 globin [Chlorella sorokiniana]